MPRTLDDLDQHRLLAAEPQMAWRFDGPDGPVTYKPQSSLQTNSSELVREAVLTGLGIAFRSTWDVASELRLGALKRVLTSFSGAADVNIYAVYAGRRLVPPKVRAFVDYFANAFGPDLPYWDRDAGPHLERVANAR
jgi:DNA-binding transcriptional LysR family regulator